MMCSLRQPLVWLCVNFIVLYSITAHSTVEHKNQHVNNEAIQVSYIDGRVNYAFDGKDDIYSLSTREKVSELSTRYLHQYLNANTAALKAEHAYNLLNELTQFVNFNSVFIYLPSTQNYNTSLNLQVAIVSIDSFGDKQLSMWGFPFILVEDLDEVVPLLNALLAG